MVLKAVAIRGHLVSCLKLDNLHTPGSGSGRRSKVQVDHNTLVGHWDEHVLAGVVATDLWR